MRPKLLAYKTKTKKKPKKNQKTKTKSQIHSPVKNKKI
jgi:hypothetical protein